MFRSSRVFRPPKHPYLERNLLGFVELLFLLRFGAFPFEEKAICGVTSGQRWMEWCAFPFLEGRVTVSDNLTKRRQNGSKIGTRDKFATHLRLEKFISNEMVIYTILLGSVISHTILYTQAVAYTMYFELGEPVARSKFISESFESILNSDSSDEREMILKQKLNVLVLK